MSYTNQNDSTDLAVYRGAVVTFERYEEFKAAAIQVRDMVRKVPVTDDPDTLKAAKKAVADARKITDRLNAERIKVKKMVLEPYMELEQKVKEIETIIKEGEDEIREKLEAIEVQRRIDKRKEIEQLWDLRAPRFIAGKYLKFNDFSDKMGPSLTNKTTTFASVENSMVAFLTAASSDLEYLEGAGERSAEYLEEYMRCLDLAQSMRTVDVRHKNLESLPTTGTSFVEIRIVGKPNIVAAKKLLEENEINYTITKEN